MASTQHEHLIQPENPNARLWRYMDLSKLMSFCWTQSLHFCRLSDLPDPFEGTLPSHAIPAVDEYYLMTERQCGRDPGPDHGYARALMAWTRASIFVNCWCMHDIESEALWRIYGHPNGVAITTSYSRLAAALPSDFYMGRVRYIDYRSQSPDPDNVFSIATHKRAFFKHEHEVRVFTQALPETRNLHTLRHPEPPPFRTQPVTFTAFEGIVVSPYAPQWFHEIVKDMVRRYDCPIPVRRSSMSVDSAGA